ncbi:hypothetical protein [Telluribacter sp. SYSU D00476]|uniref:hypothetical protein n=1 Tax=Telluribacter sp. SYSU D00476 TaxID=2811430 RepID=UPI001FF5BEAF|nr:hypothetical protein [Telluribacter sp. SYSU D00476]
MNSKKAYELLNDQRKQLYFPNLEPISWKERTVSLVKEVFGDTSIEYYSVSNAPLSVDKGPLDDWDYTKAQYSRNKELMIELLGDCMDSITENGLPRKKGDGFFRWLINNEPYIAMPILLTSFIRLILVIGLFAIIIFLLWRAIL